MAQSPPYLHGDAVMFVVQLQHHLMQPPVLPQQLPQQRPARLPQLRYGVGHDDPTVNPNVDPSVNPNVTPMLTPMLTPKQMPHRGHPIQISARSTHWDLLRYRDVGQVNPLGPTAL